MEPSQPVTGLTLNAVERLIGVVTFQTHRVGLTRRRQIDKGQRMGRVDPVVKWVRVALAAVCCPNELGLCWHIRRLILPPTASTG